MPSVVYKTKSGKSKTAKLAYTKAGKDAAAKLAKRTGGKVLSSKPKRPRKG
jgi:hypothetical protein